jgi:hypothetical protein
MLEQGGHIRRITEVRYADIAPAQELLDIGEDFGTVTITEGCTSQWWTKNIVLVRSTSRSTVFR